MRDNISNVQTVDLGKDTLSGVTPNASAWLDTLGFSSAALELLTDAVTDAGNGTISVTITADGDDNIVKGVVGYNGSKRYIRFNTIGTTGTDAVIRTLGRMAKPAQAPTTYVGASVAAT